MDKDKLIKNSNAKKVDNNKINRDHEDYAYDFIPTLDEWVNIDEQREKAEELEDI